MLLAFPRLYFITSSITESYIYDAVPGLLEVKINNKFKVINEKQTKTKIRGEIVTSQTCEKRVAGRSSAVVFVARTLTRAPNDNTNILHANKHRMYFILV